MKQRSTGISGSGRRRRRLQLLHESPRRFHRVAVGMVVVVLLLLPVFWLLSLLLSRHHPRLESTLLRRESGTRMEGSEQVLGPCAINLYGLPRSFRALVLPSLMANVVRPNLPYKCDYFVHYHDRPIEPVGRDGRGGTLDPSEVLALAASVHNVSGSLQPVPIIKYRRTTEQEFQDSYRSLLHEIRTAVDSDGEPLYLPVNHPSYDDNTIGNLIRMFHGQQAVWELMERQKRHYSRVAMLRNDVFYVTPIDIYQIPERSLVDTENEFAVVPGFSQHPVNDRLIYGPYDAVRIWAATRFVSLRRHAEMMRKQHPGDGLHSERFLAYGIFPDIRDAGVPLLVDRDLCFLRVRSDRSIRLDDCSAPGGTTEHTQRAVEAILQRPCLLNRTADSKLIHLECRDV